MKVVELTPDEILVIVDLMRRGVRSTTVEEFDAASEHYNILKTKLRRARELVIAPPLPPVPPPAEAMAQ